MIQLLGSNLSLNLLFVQLSLFDAGAVSALKLLVTDIYKNLSGRNKVNRKRFFTFKGQTENKKIKQDTYYVAELNLKC